jgi:succinate dehydrogenase / fumarate reductase, cytochrome b subunit
MTMGMQTKGVPAAYVGRRIHSLFGLWFVFFLTEHLVTNSQAALLFGHDGAGFIRSVNWLHNLPYRVVVEIALLAVPILYHAFWGIYYMISSKSNSWKSNGSKPSLPQYKRNHAYTWQRITAWILLVGIALHVLYMRFLDYPEGVQLGKYKYYFTHLSLDPGLYTVAKRLNVHLYSPKMIEQQVQQLQNDSDEMQMQESAASRLYDGLSEEYDEDGMIPFSNQTERTFDQAQKDRQRQAWIDELTVHPIEKGQVIAVSKDFGTATLLHVRNTFKNCWIGALYSIFVLCAAFHGFNGLWTFFITWGTILRIRSQKTMSKVCTVAMVIIAFLGLASIWGTYWINLKH